MKQASATPNSSKSWAFYGCGILLLVPILLLLMGFLAYFLRESSARRELEEKLAKIQERNLPVDSKSLTDYYGSLTDDEQTGAWIELIGDVTSDAFNKSTEGVPIFDGSLDEEETRLVKPWMFADVTREFLDQHDELIQRAERMSLEQLNPEARPINLNIKFDSFNTLLPNTQNMRQVARLLSLEATMEIHDGDSSGARRAISALYGNSDTIAGEPFIVSQLVSLAIEGIAIDRLKLALELDVLNERDLQRLLKIVLQRTNISQGWQLGLHGERAAALAAFEDPGAYGLGAAISPARDSLAYLDLVEKALEVNTDDFDVMINGLELLDLEVQNLSNAGLLSMLESRVTMLLTPAMSNYGHAFVRLPTRNRLIALAIGLRLFEKKNGEFPADLEELKTEFPELDPALLKPRGKKPFGYGLEEDNELVIAQLWGFDPSQQKVTPASPPDLELEGMWTLRLPESGTETSPPEQP